MYRLVTSVIRRREGVVFEVVSFLSSRAQLFSTAAIAHTNVYYIIAESWALSSHPPRIVYFEYSTATLIYYRIVIIIIICLNYYVMRCTHITRVPYNIRRIILFRNTAWYKSIYRIIIGPTSGNFVLARPRLLYTRSLH